MQRKQMHKGHDGLIPLERMPKKELEVFRSRYNDLDAYDARCQQWLVGGSSAQTNVAGLLWETEELAHSIGLKNLRCRKTDSMGMDWKWLWQWQMATIPRNADNAEAVMRFEYIQRLLQWVLVKWVCERSVLDLSWLAGYVKQHERSRFPRVELPLGTSTGETKPRQLTKLILSEFLRVSRLSILPSDVKREGAKIPTREYLKKIIKEEWGKIDRNPDTINKEWSRALKELGLDGLPSASIRLCGT